jgi:hypothetical protein
VAVELEEVDDDLEPHEAERQKHRAREAKIKRNFVWFRFLLKPKSALWEGTHQSQK